MCILSGEIHSSLLFIHGYDSALEQNKTTNPTSRCYNIKIPEQTCSAKHARSKLTRDCSLLALERNSSWGMHQGIAGITSDVCEALRWLKALCSTAHQNRQQQSHSDSPHPIPHCSGQGETQHSGESGLGTDRRKVILLDLSSLARTGSLPTLTQPLGQRFWHFPSVMQTPFTQLLHCSPYTTFIACIDCMYLTLRVFESSPT